MLAGAVAAVRQLTFGLGATGLHEPVVWGLYVVCFAYFAGIGAGALTVASAALCLARDGWRTVARPAAVVSLCALILAGLFITIDLGRPDRAILLVLKGRLQSPLIWDSIILNAMTGLAALYTFVVLRAEVLRKGGPVEGRLARLLTIGARGETTQPVPKAVRLLAGLMVGVVPVIYVLTARVFAVVQAKPTWHTSILGPIFLASALLSGLAAVAVVTCLADGPGQAGLSAKIRRPLVTALACLIVIDLVLSFAPFATMRQFGRPSQPGVVSPLHGAAAVEVLVGMAIPLVMLLATRKKERPWVVTPGILILIGVFFKRWHIIVPAMRHRALPLPQATYQPNMVEVAIATGLLALGILLTYALIQMAARLAAAGPVPTVVAQSTGGSAGPQSGA